MDKVIVAEYMPAFGWVKVRHTSKFEGGALARGRQSVAVIGNPAYAKYQGQIVAVNEACRKDFPKIAAKLAR